LCQMLPQKVANELKNGRSVKAGKCVFPWSNALVWLCVDSNG
jgi:hypothetical protein